MRACAELRVLFCAPAGPRRGYGHLVRCRSLARALGVRPLVCLRGPASSADVALALGCDVVRGGASRLLRALAPDLLIVDDPIARAAAAWIAAARARGIAVVSVHDLGLGAPGADLRIDGSIVTRRGRGDRRAALGPAFAILDPRLAAARRRRRRAVVISLGGGPRATLACAIASEVARQAPALEVRVIGGFVARPPAVLAGGQAPPNVVWLEASASLAEEIAGAVVAVVGGGVSLYEACALGTPAVGVPVVPSQRPTVAGFVARGAALGQPRPRIVPAQVAGDALRLVTQAPLRQALAREGRRVVDGRGAARAAARIARLVKGR